VLQKIAQGRRANEDMQKDIEKHHQQIQDYEALCAEISEKPADLALAWLLHNPVVTAPIIGRHHGTAHWQRVSQVGFLMGFLQTQSYLARTGWRSP
jgi:aryl-alcohol dehydrogenase-like predicted oxidoreductase